ncbi:MAG TPA: ShlB/FhaC/HecB family hemolysin secretion/activation protein [Sphingobium sp.]|nr:ShlB/FhaC/HecB family hemolysin secretion/activation protein [Sphingobium sp.]
MAALLAAGAPLLLAMQSTATPLSPPLIGTQGQPAPPEAPEAVPSSPTPATDDLVAVRAGDGAAMIKGIDFLGVQAPAPVAQAARAFLGRPASRDNLAALAQAISAAYARSGIALYTVAIPQQDLSGGQVKVQLAEGFVEDVVYPQGASPLVRAYAERLRAERPLGRRALERYLSLMRDIPGAKVEVGLLRGGAPGAVRLSVTPSRKRSEFSFGVDNQAQSGLGRGQLRAGAKLYSLLRDGDRTDITLLSAIDLKRYRYVGIGHQTPLGSDGLTLGLSASHLDTRLKGLPISGEAWTLGLSMSYPIIRGYKRNLTVSAGIDGLNSDAALLGAVLSSDHIRAVRAGLGYAQTGKKSALAAAVSASRGIDIFGARGTAGFTDPVFTKLVGRASYDRMIGKRLTARLRAVGQYSRDRLSGAERLAIGGPEFGRAFDAAILSGDRGAAGSMELAWRPLPSGRIKDSEVYGFVDGARIRVLERAGLPSSRYDLASAGMGARLVYNPHASLTLEGARVLDTPYAAARGGWRFNIGWHVRMRR